MDKVAGNMMFILVTSASSIVLFFGTMRVVHIESGWAHGYWLATALTVLITLVAILSVDYGPDE